MIRKVQQPPSQRTRKITVKQGISYIANRKHDENGWRDLVTMPPNTPFNEYDFFSVSGSQ